MKFSIFLKPKNLKFGLFRFLRFFKHKKTRFLQPLLTALVCLLELYVKTTDRIFMKIFTRDASVDKDELIIFKRSSHQHLVPDLEFFLYLQHSRIFFHNLALIS